MSLVAVPSERIKKRKGRKKWTALQDFCLKFCLTVFGRNFALIHQLMPEYKEHFLKKKACILDWPAHFMETQRQSVPLVANPPCITEQDIFSSRFSTVNLELSPIADNRLVPHHFHTPEPASVSLSPFAERPTNRTPIGPPSERHGGASRDTVRNPFFEAPRKRNLGLLPLELQEDQPVKLNPFAQTPTPPTLENDEFFSFFTSL